MYWTTGSPTRAFLSSSEVPAGRENAQPVRTAGRFAWLPVELLRCLPGELVRPPPVRIGRFRYRTGFVARRAAEDLPPSGRWNRPCATPRAAGIRERAPAEQTQAPASGLAPPGVLVARPAEPAYEMNAVQTESVIPLATPGCRASPRGHVCPSPKMPFSTSLYGGLRAGGRRRPYGAPSLNPKC